MVPYNTGYSTTGLWYPKFEEQIVDPNHHDMESENCQRLITVTYFELETIDLINGRKPNKHHAIYPSRVGTELTQFNIVNIMVADDLAPWVARTSAPMILTMTNRSALVLLEKGFQLPVSCWCGGMTQNVNIYFVLNNLSCKKTMMLRVSGHTNSSDAGNGNVWLWGSIPGLLMLWLLKSPEHRQAWYWLCRTDGIYCCSKVNFIYLGWAKSRIWFKMWIHLLWS